MKVATLDGVRCRRPPDSWRARDWMPRARMILKFGETKTFQPFDRLGQQQESQGKSLDQLLNEFASLRVKNLAELRFPESPARGPRTAGTTSGPRTGDSFTIAGDLGSSRFDASAPNFPNHGPPIPGGCGSVERLSGRAVLQGSQLLARLVCRGISNRRVSCPRRVLRMRTKVEISTLSTKSQNPSYPTYF